MALKATELLKNVTSSTKVLEVDQLSDLSSSLSSSFAQKSDIKDGKLFIQKNGETIATFTANQDGEVSANIIADAPVWGNITGNINEQEDLVAELAAKADRNDLTEYIPLSVASGNQTSTNPLVDKQYVDESITNSLSDVVKTSDVVPEEDADLTRKIATIGGKEIKVPEQQDVAWGNITGNLTAQTDLTGALNLKADKTELDVLSDYVKLAADKQEISGAVNVTAGLSVGGQALTTIISTQLPTKMSDLENDSGFATSAYVNSKTTTAYPAAGVSALTKAGDVADFVNSSINAFAAYYITKDAAGHSFATHAELLAATTLYSGGQVRVPTKNDYAIVAEDEDHTTALSVDPTTRYVYMGDKDEPYDSSKWSFQYIVNNTALTQAQINAINSGITAAKVADIDVAKEKAEAVESKVNPANQAVAPSSGYYNCYDTKLNALGQVADGAKICLKDYSFSKGYAIKFNTPENQEVRLQFYKDEGSGPVLMTGNINEKYSFPMNSSYVIEVKFENIDVRPDGWTGNRQKMTFRTIEWSEED